MKEIESQAKEDFTKTAQTEQQIMQQQLKKQQQQAIQQAQTRGEVMGFNDDEGQAYGKKAKPMTLPAQTNRNFQIQSSKARSGDQAMAEEDLNLNEFERMEQEILNDDGEIDFEKLRQLEKKGIQPLPTVDHSVIEYEAFEKDFYKEHPDITNMPADVINAKRRQLAIRVEGERVPRPLFQFQHLQIDPWLVELLQQFTTPTPIQSQALPCGLSGRDIIGIAKTGSGKTLAYLIPMLVHILDQRVLEKGEGPIGLVLAPTRELCTQIYDVYRKFCKRFRVNVLPMFGGMDQHQLWKDLKAGKNEIVVGTPGRVIEMARKKGFNMNRCTCLVIDEADQMFSMGFEYQVRTIVGQIRPDRQTMLFSATFKSKVEELCSDILTDPIKIVIGKENVSNEDISQSVFIFRKDLDKLQWLIQNLDNFLTTPGHQVLIFANQIHTVDTLVQDLQVVYRSRGVSGIHGDKSQYERTQIINAFKEGKTNILIATNVASRGLDIPSIKTVINYDCSKDKEDHIHRIGRTGRAGDREGVAYTLLTQSETQKASMLVKIFEQSNQVVTQELEDLALQDPNFKRSRVTIGVKNFNMNINIKKEQDKMKKTMRKIGDRSGIGFAQDDHQPAKRKDAVSEVEAINQKIRREAEMMIQQKKIFAGENVLDRLDQYSEQFKQSMKATFSNNFVQTGTVQTGRKEATVTYMKKDQDQVIKETVTLDKVKEPEPIIPSRFGASRFSMTQAPALQSIPVTINGVTMVNRFNFNIQREVDQLRKRSRSKERKRDYSRSRSNSRDKYRKNDINKQSNHRRKRSYSSSSSSSSSYSSYSSSSRSSQQSKNQESVKEQEKPIEQPPEALNPPVEGVKKRQSKWDR
ncbi:hypothetical protein FGO68_gene1017 [Halteria grandinella]|uniref:RNA helicase n=1 Tax=Halteria grandinella TaxID=5974 RepID=A0A8J8P1F4_HALGN|nr:hypothetical protein FGO68_gene1017 [Halteria grandinella]